MLLLLLCSKAGSLAIPLRALRRGPAKDMSSRSRRAIVIGGSMSGLFAALYLRRLGWEVTVHERSSGTLTGRGAGIMTHPEMRAALADLGLDTVNDFGVP